MVSPEDHPVLDEIHNLLTCRGTVRMSECVEFVDDDGQRYEIVVRPIDDD